MRLMACPTSSTAPTSAGCRRLPADRIPHHVGVILDGNRRWARERRRDDRTAATSAGRRQDRGLPRLVRRGRRRGRHAVAALDRQPRPAAAGARAAAGDHRGDRQRRSPRPDAGGSPGRRARPAARRSTAEALKEAADATERRRRAARQRRRRLRRPARDRRRGPLAAARARRRGAPRSTSSPRSSTSSTSPSTSTPAASPTPTWSSAPRASSGCPASCSGRARTRSSTSARRTGRTSARSTSCARCAPTAPATAASAPEALGVALRDASGRRVRALTVVATAGIRRAVREAHRRMQRVPTGGRHPALGPVPDPAHE